MTEILTQNPTQPESVDRLNETEIPVNFLVSLSLAREVSKRWRKKVQTDPEIRGEYATSVFASAFNLETLAVVGLQKYGLGIRLAKSSDERMIRVYSDQQRFMSLYCNGLRSVFDQAENPKNTTSRYMPQLFDQIDLLSSASKDYTALEEKYWMTGLLSKHLDALTISFGNDGRLNQPYREYEELADRGIKPFTHNELAAISDTINREAITKIKES